MPATGETCNKGHLRTPETTYTVERESSKGKRYTVVHCRWCQGMASRGASRSCRDCESTGPDVFDSITGRCHRCQIKRVEEFEAMSTDDLVDFLTVRFILRERASGVGPAA